MATVTLPGAGKDFVSITTGTDDQVVLQTAIKNLFNAAKPNITAVTVPSGAAGDKGFFNLVFENESSKVSASAGANVQAIIDIGKGVDTLTGGASTTVLVGNAAGNVFNTNNNNATVFGGAGADTVNVTGSAIAYLEGGKNQVNLNGGDSINLQGIGGADTVNITGGDDSVTTTYAATVNVSGSKGTETLTLAQGSKVSITGANDTVTLSSSKSAVTMSGASDKLTVAGVTTVNLTGNKVSESVVLLSNGSTVNITGSSVTAGITGALNTINLSGDGENVSMGGSGAGTVNITDGTNDTITSSAQLSVKISAANSSDTLSFAGNSTISLGVSDTINLAGAKGSATVTASGSATIIGGTGLLKFTGAANAKDSIQAGQGSATLTAGSGASDKFIAGSGTNYLFTHAATGGGKDTFIGGAHNDTMVGAGTDKAHTDLFMFESSLKGGTHTIQNFTHGKDTIDLVGYTKAQIDAAITAGAKTFNAKTGTETITLSDHTKITVSGLHGALGKSDFTGS